MITIVGASGFVGSHLVRALTRDGIPNRALARGAPLAGQSLGHVIYCAGLTGDFRGRPTATVDAHVGLLGDIIRDCRFDSILYLSSTRVYRRGPGVAREGDILAMLPGDPDDLYQLSKATGEALTLSLGNRGRVARLSNVFGPGQSPGFLSAILDEAMREGTITLQSAAESERDYVSVADVAALLPRIALDGRHTIYNVASGVQRRNGDVAEAIATLTGCKVCVTPGAARASAPPVDTSRIREEFGFAATDIMDALPMLVERWR